jgi:glycosidase
MTMRKAVQLGRLLPLVLVAVSLQAQDFKREVIYQIATDRFFDGSAGNNNPAQSPGLYDSTKTVWRKYWGGDHQGIQQKIAYLQGMGVTAIWISPPVDNLNLGITFGGEVTAPYHGYQARDFKKLEEHFGDTNNGWAAFDAMVAAAHAAGIKVIVDFAPNHSNQNDAGEFGALYDNGVFLGSYTNDPGGYFFKNPNISNWDNRYELQYYTLFNLTDINPGHASMDAYLKASLALFQQHGVDGFRIDAPKHAIWGWQDSMTNAIFTNGPSWVFGEWYQGGTGDALYKDSVKFANTSGMSLLDFPLNTAIRNVFGSGQSFNQIESTLAAENTDYTWKNDLVTFVDNHDMSRFLTLLNNTTRLHQALAFILTQRGVPCIYYGTEQYLHNDTAGGGDPYNRPMMPGFSTTTTAYNLIKRLSDLRRLNNAVPYGTHQQRWINDDVYIYERKFFNDVVLVAINKNTASGYSIGGLNTALPAGSYSNYVAGVSGLTVAPSISVSSGSGGNNPVTTFTLGAGQVGVWHLNASSSTTPWVGSIGPTRGQTGVRVTLAGEGFGAATGSVLVGTTSATVNSWSSTSVTFTVPSVSGGNYAVTLKKSDGTAANTINFTKLTAKLVPVTFTVTNAPTSFGENVFLTGSTIELGNWSTAWNTALGPMYNPSYPNWFLTTSMPAGTTIQFKAIKINGYGPGAVWECGANHSYTVPASGTAYVTFSHQGWCP